MDTAPQIRLLRPGTFTPVEGEPVTFSEADLAAIAAAYDPAADPAPLVVGHPKLDAPAYGWASALAVEGGELVAQVDPDRLEPAFAEAVRGGRFARVSGSFYPPDHKANPKPGSWYLKHIGFLGAFAPAVKGLGTVSLAESEGLVTLETNQEKDMSERDTTDLAEREAALGEREQALQERETALAERERQAVAAAAEARHEANVAFAEALVGATKLAPAAKDLAVVVLDDLDPSKAVSFGEGEGKEELTPLAAFKRLLEGAGTLVALGEHAGSGRTAEEEKDPQVIADRAVAFAEEQRKAGRTITIAAAVRHVMKDGAA